MEKRGIMRLFVTLVLIILLIISIYFLYSYFSKPYVPSTMIASNLPNTYNDCNKSFFQETLDLNYEVKNEKLIINYPIPNKFVEISPGESHPHFLTEEIVVNINFHRLINNIAYISLYYNANLPAKKQEDFCNLIVGCNTLEKDYIANSKECEGLNFDCFDRMPFGDDQGCGCLKCLN